MHIDGLYQIHAFKPTHHYFPNLIPTVSIDPSKLLDLGSIPLCLRAGFASSVDPNAQVIEYLHNLVKAEEKFILNTESLSTCLYGSRFNLNLMLSRTFASRRQSFSGFVNGKKYTFASYNVDEYDQVKSVFFPDVQNNLALGPGIQYICADREMTRLYYEVFRDISHLTLEATGHAGPNSIYSQGRPKGVKGDELFVLNDGRRTVLYFENLDAFNSWYPLQKVVDGLGLLDRGIQMIGLVSSTNLQAQYYSHLHDANSENLKLKFGFEWPLLFKGHGQFITRLKAMDLEVTYEGETTPRNVKDMGFREFMCHLERIFTALERGRFSGYITETDVQTFRDGFPYLADLNEGEIRGYLFLRDYFSFRYSSDHACRIPIAADIAFIQEEFGIDPLTHSVRTEMYTVFRWIASKLPNGHWDYNLGEVPYRSRFDAWETWDNSISLPLLSYLDYYFS